MVRRTFPLRPALTKLPFGFADVALFFGLFLLIYGLTHIGKGLFVEFRPPAIQPKISLDPNMLPYYAARSTLRMFIALGASLLFTFSYGYVAAKNKRAEQALIPLLDILQSVPVLAFLTITVTGFMAMFPNSLFGLELASIFAAFTGQAWNMTFAFYHSMITLPRELDEASTVFRLSKWRRFFTLEIPASMIGLVWNAMMSFGGAWFYVAFSEVLSVKQNGVEQSYVLPGIGSYVAAASDQGDTTALLYASLTMVIVIVVIDQFFWRPLVAWSEKFKLEKTMSVDVAQSWVLDLIRAAKLPRAFGKVWRKWLRWFRAIKRPQIKLPHFELGRSSKHKPLINMDIWFGAMLGAIVVGALWLGTKFVTQEVATKEIGIAFYLGFLTFLRVLTLLAIATAIWTPVGVWIGFNPRLARMFQPIVQFLSSFPSNFIFPVLTLFFLRAGVTLNWGSILLMALGAQWYIMFNSIAGAMSVPADLREMAANMSLKGWSLWQKLIIPAIFPAWVTGAITASGGAWNASIAAEFVKWKDNKLVASGLGAYIKQASDSSDVPRIVLGVTVMCIFVVGVNRFGWRRLYELAETKYRLG